jgi:hypothetical protein
MTVTRYRCNGCGNLTRFDVIASRRTRAFHHYTIGGELTVEDSEVLAERIEQVVCRWCGADDERIEAITDEEAASAGSGVASDSEQLHHEPA